MQCDAVGSMLDAYDCHLKSAGNAANVGRLLVVPASSCCCTGVGMNASICVLPQHHTSYCDTVLVHNKNTQREFSSYVRDVICALLHAVAEPGFLGVLAM